MTLDKNTNRGRLEGWIRDLDLDVVGVGDLSRYDREMVDLDETVRTRYTSAVVFGLVLSWGVIDTVEAGPNQLYLGHYRQLNHRLDTAACSLGRAIEKLGYGALPFAASHLVDWRHQKAHISHKHMAAIAGLGWIGRNNLLVHPVYGSRLRLNTVLTDMPLPVAAPLEIGCGSCRSCLEKCPGGAIKEEQSMFDHQGCFATLKQLKNAKNIGHNICGICIEACRGTK